MDNFFFGKTINFEPSKEDTSCNDTCIFTPSTNYVREFSKGKSFAFHIWNDKDCYNNDDFIVDFVKYDQKLWVALKTSINEVPHKGSEYWEVIAEGVSNIEFRQVGNQVQWKYEDELNWKLFFEIDSVSEFEIKEMLDELNVKYGNTYDTQLSETSTNAVQNKVIVQALKSMENEIQDQEQLLSEIYTKTNSYIGSLEIDDLFQEVFDYT